MTSRLQVTLVTPERQVLRQEFDQVSAPSLLGEVGILPEHRALLAILQEGAVTLRRGDTSEVYAISGGFMEVEPDNQVTILAETAEKADAIDLARAEASRKNAEKRLQTLDTNDNDYQDTWSRLRRAEVRVQVGRG